jgi:hypothetical protein
MSEIHEVVAAFADGERVNVDGLERALATPEGRDYLIELLALREVTVGQAAVGSNLAATTRGRPGNHRLLAAAAAIVCLSAIAGYAVGSHTARQAPGAVPAAPSSQFADSAPAKVAPPEPTRVIRLEPGVDWHERDGGN